ncbi:hypothetical protein AB0K51_19075 [Kitasatospora sp. NPDC049285]|uniref:hypothetical protein n=1 Tax=Kitasatospora sp. NPDC049285 TaxID=3157096 RepID=UPI00341326D5
MNQPTRRPLWHPFSEPAAHTPSPDGRARMLAAERTPFLEPTFVQDSPELSQASSARRRLGPGGIAEAEPVSQAPQL